MVLLDAAQKADDVVTAVTTAVGAPHNYSAQDATAAATPPAAAAAAATAVLPSTAAPAAAVTQEAAEVAAGATQQPAMTDEQVTHQIPCEHQASATWPVHSTVWLSSTSALDIMCPGVTH